MYNVVEFHSGTDVLIVWDQGGRLEDYLPTGALMAEELKDLGAMERQPSRGGSTEEDTITWVLPHHDANIFATACGEVEP